MAETPMDIIKKHLTDILNAKWLPDGAPSAVELANDLDRELREKFTIISNEEIDAVEVKPTGFNKG